MIIKENHVVKSAETSTVYRVISYEVIPEPDILAYALHREAGKSIDSGECYVFDDTDWFKGVCKLEEIDDYLIKAADIQGTEFIFITIVIPDKEFSNRLVAYRYVAAGVNRLESLC